MVQGLQHKQLTNPKLLVFPLKHGLNSQVQLCRGIVFKEDLSLQDTFLHRQCFICKSRVQMISTDNGFNLNLRFRKQCPKQTMVFTLNLDSRKNVLYRQNLYLLVRVKKIFRCTHIIGVAIVRVAEIQGDISIDICGRI